MEHTCGVCKRGEPTDGSFLGFHANNRVRTGEVCDDCAHIHGCNCCDAIVVFAWETYLLNVGIPDYELADHERPVERHSEWY